VLWKRGIAMNTWVTDLIPMSGATYLQLIKELYRENRPSEGKLIIRGERVDLNRIRANLLNVIALADHISPPCQSESIMTKVGSQDQRRRMGKARKADPLEENTFVMGMMVSWRSVAANVASHQWIV
jgi:hypothetical protein